VLGKSCNSHQFRTRNNLIGTQQTRSKANKSAEKSTKLFDFRSLITVWLQVRVLPGPPAFAREASEGCRAEAHLGEGGRGRGRELRLGKPDIFAREASEGCHAVAHRAKAGWAHKPRLTKIPKTTPCKVAGRRRRGWLCARKQFDTLGKSPALEQDDFSSNRHLALSFCLSMIFSENRCPLFRIML
jgi:hypothetical protein